MHGHITSTFARQCIECSVIKKVIARRWGARNSCVFIDEPEPVFVAAIRGSTMPTVHIHNQQVTTTELWIDKRIIVRMNCLSHFLSSPFSGSYSFEPMRPRRHKQLASRFIEIA